MILKFKRRNAAMVSANSISNNDGIFRDLLVIFLQNPAAKLTICIVDSKMQRFCCDTASLGEAEVADHV